MWGSALPWAQGSAWRSALPSGWEWPWRWVLASPWAQVLPWAQAWQLAWALPSERALVWGSALPWAQGGRRGGRRRRRSWVGRGRLRVGRAPLGWPAGIPSRTVIGCHDFRRFRNVYNKRARHGYNCFVRVQQFYHVAVSNPELLKLTSLYVTLHDWASIIGVPVAAAGRAHARIPNGLPLHLHAAHILGVTAVPRQNNPVLNHLRTEGESVAAIGRLGIDPWFMRGAAVSLGQGPGAGIYQT